MSVEYPINVIRDLLDGKLPWSETHQIMSAHKDADRFQKYREILSERLGEEDVVLAIGERLVIVHHGTEFVVRCDCGHEFGDFRANWKLGARILVRDSSEALEEIYPGRLKCDPDWMEIRELICPGCAALLEVEAVPPGYPLSFDFLPDIEALYESFLGVPSPGRAENTDTQPGATGG
jgi:acetone carboxylase, gamma subunit